MGEMQARKNISLQKWWSEYEDAYIGNIWQKP
jgi:hypothetical protein